MAIAMIIVIVNFVMPIIVIVIKNTIITSTILTLFGRLTSYTRQTSVHHANCFLKLSSMRGIMINASIRSKKRKVEICLVILLID